MAESKDCHVVVEIPVDGEHQQKLSSAITTITAIQNHPLMEISKSPGHLLLLKLWQREEDLSGRRIAARETRMDSIRREIFQICCFFFIFHAMFFTILFTSVSENNHHGDDNVVCRKWWIPSVLSVCTSFCIVFLVQVKLYRFWKVSRQLQRERGDGRAVMRCISELRMKGASFDLSKEPQIGKKMKSSSVEIKWKPLTWLSQFGLPCFQAHPLCLMVHLLQYQQLESGKLAICSKQLHLRLQQIQVSQVPNLMFSTYIPKGNGSLVHPQKMEKGNNGPQGLFTVDKGRCKPVEEKRAAQPQCTKYPAFMVQGREFKEAKCTQSTR